MIHIVIPGDPTPKGRPRFDPRTGHAFTDERTEVAEQRVGWSWRAARPGPRIENHDVAVSMIFVRATRIRVDLDNLEKLVLDGLNTIAWRDDSQVTRLSSEKRLSAGPDDPPRTEVWVTELATITGEPDGPTENDRRRHPSSAGRAPVARRPRGPAR